ncbi:MAG: phosphoribosyltransferase [Candidatus Eisenbacteria bacterium]|nr:phosphoribosyltransferase [Candidatus Eisenbacteria bacterium]
MPAILSAIDQAGARKEGNLGILHVAHRVGGPAPVFEDREDAGRTLSEFISGEVAASTAVLGLPRGGIAVGAAVADSLDAPLVPLVVRKLPIPISPEMGFGAVAIDGKRSLNDSVVTAFGISREEADRITADVMEEVRRRAREYVGTDAPPEVEGRDVLIVDDGLATGFTVLVAAKMVRNRGPRSMTLAVPCSPAGTLHAMEDRFDGIHCLYSQKSPSFAVASYYRDFHDMSDEEVKRYLDGRFSRSMGGAASGPAAAEG